MSSTLNENGRLVWSVDTDSENKPVLATRDQWVKQYMDMYASDEGMGVPVNEEMISKIADALSDENGIMYDLSRDKWDELPVEKQPLPLDQVSYQSSFDDWTRIATERKKLFVGPSLDFAPTAIRENIAQAELGNNDYKHRLDTKQTRVAQTAMQQAAQIDIEQQAAEAAKSDPEPDVAPSRVMAATSSGLAATKSVSVDDGMGF